MFFTPTPGPSPQGGGESAHGQTFNEADRGSD